MAELALEPDEQQYRQAMLNVTAGLHGGRIIQPGDRRLPNGVLYRDLGPASDILTASALVYDARVWDTGRREGLRVIVSVDETRFGARWHLSISHRQRYPVWDEIHQARDAFLPRDLDFMMILPREGFYVNVHHRCFQIHETPEGWLMR